MIKLKGLVVLAALFAVQAAWADLPLTVEDLLTAQNRWRTELGLVYANRQTSDVSTGEPITIQIGQAQFITLPTAIGAARLNSDTLVVTPGLRYGYSADTELYGRASWLNDDARIEDVEGQRSDSTSRFSSLWLGINHRFRKEDDKPALLGFVEAAALENAAVEGTELVSGKSWLVGMTTYRTDDPLVLSLTAAYRLNLERDDGNEDREPGNYLLLNPSLSFAVNNNATLSSGITWRRIEADRIEGDEVGQTETETDLSLGLAYSLGQRSTLHLTTRTNISGGDRAELGLTWLYKLGDLPGREED